MPGADVSVVPALWQEVQAATACFAWLPVAGPLGVMTLAPVWQAPQPLPVVPQTGVAMRPALYGSAWQEAVEQEAAVEPLAFASG